MIRFINILSIAILSNNLHAQVQKENYLPKIDEIKNSYSKIDVKDFKLELAFYTAINYFPEFRNVPIVVKFSKINTSMQCRPSLTSFITSKRKYIILVNNNSSSPKYPFNASFSALVGCFGHELAHIVRYETQSKSKILYDGLKFLINQDFRSKYEKDTDIITAKKGLGYEQYEFARYIFSHPKLSKEYLEFKKSIYNSPDDLLTIYKKY